MSTSEGKVNGQDVMNVTSGLYPFDAAEVNVTVSLGDDKELTHVLTKPTLKDHLDREESLKRVSRAVSRNEFVSEQNEKEVNVSFYDLLIVKATGRVPNPEHADRPGADKYIIKEFTRDSEDDKSNCLKFTSEKKNRAINEAYSSSFEVQQATGDPFDMLFERDEEMVVVQEVGGKGSPFVVKYFMRPPTPSQRTEFGRSVQIKEKYEKKNNRSLLTSLNLNKGVKLFAALLSKIEGGMVQGQPYNEELRQQFLDQIDAMFQYSVIDALVASYDSRD